MPIKEGVTILWLDDQIRELTAYVKTLEAAGFVVHTSATSEEALYKAQIETAFTKVTKPIGIKFCHQRV